jgi:hypothetical protein
MKRFLLRVSVGMLAGLGLLVAPTNTFADYGRGAVYQIEISANNVGQVPGDGAWIWVALNRDGTGDYAAADCVHTGSLGLNTAAHSAGDVRWTSDGTNLTITGMNLIGGALPVILVVPAQYGHYVEDSDAVINVLQPNPFDLPGFGGTAQVQVAR